MKGIGSAAGALGFVIMLAAFSFCSQLRAEELKSFSKVITSPEEEFAIEVAGARDPENVEITVENLGDTPVVDPRITVNGKFDWYDINTMVAEITRDCTTDEEKAMAIWEWVHWKRYQRSPEDHSALHPVRAMNGYGYGICGHTAAWLKALCLAAGIQARVQEIWGHTVNEAYFNGGWHFLDGNVKVFYTARDNRTLASLAELEKDGWLIQRTIHAHDPWVRVNPPNGTGEYERYITTWKDNYIEDGYDSEIAKNYTMAYTLKPGERLIRWWDPVLGKYEGRDKRPEIPERYANGQLIWEPDLQKLDVKDYLNIIENVTTHQQDHQEPAIHVAELQDDSYTRPSRFTVPVKSAYPVIGGKFECKLVKQAGASASISYGTPDFDRGGLYTYRWGSGTQEVNLYLDQFILNHEPVYDYEIGFTLNGNARAKNPAQAGVDWFRTTSDLRVSPHGLPALSLGKNVIRYRDSSKGAKSVRVTWKWRERNDDHAPGPVNEAVSAAEFTSLTPTLQWKAAKDADPGDKVEDYQVIVSLRPDCRWPISMSLYRNLGSDKSEWTMPESFLNPGTAYYWRVRARDSHGEIGQWGKIFSFRTTDRAK